MFNGGLIMTKQKQKLGQLAFAHFSQAFKGELHNLHYDDVWNHSVDVERSVEQKLKLNGIPKKFRIILNNIMIEHLDSDPKECEVLSNKILAYLPFYKRLITDPDLAKAGIYALSILLSPKAIDQNRHLGLMFIRYYSMYHGFSLFDFLVDEVDFTHDYAKKDLSSVSFIYGNKLEQAMGYLVLLIEHGDKTARDNESKYLWFVNTLFNQFLFKNHIIRVNDHHKYELTKRTKDVLVDPKASLSLFFTRNKMAFVPDAGWPKVMSYGLHALAWISKHPQYSQYYGLAFAIEICSEGAFNSFDDYTGSNDGKEYILGIFPSVYLSIILPLYVAILHNPFQELDIHTAELKLYSCSPELKANAKYTQHLIDQLDKLNDTLRLFYKKISSAQHDDHHEQKLQKLSLTKALGIQKKAINHSKNK